MTDQLEKKGENGDTVLGHLTIGEIVIPRKFAEDEQFRKYVAEWFRRNGTDLRRFIVGDAANKTNHETGYREFGFFSSINPFKQFKHIVHALSSVFSPPIPKAPELPPPPKAPEPTQAAAPATLARASQSTQAGNAKARATAAAGASGGSGTATTSPQGLIEQVKTANNTLLGG